MGTQITSVGAFLLSASMAVCAGCASDDDQLDDPAPPAHLELVAAVAVDSQPAGVRIDVFRCEATRPSFTTRIGFSAGALDEFDAFSETSVRLAKDHLFARADISLDHGCYRASVAPLDMHQRPISTCSRAKTAEMPLGPNVQRSVLVVAGCGDKPSDTPIVGGRLNFAPSLSALTHELDLASGGFEVCAQTFDPEGDPVRVEWRARTESGREVAPGEVHHSTQHHWRRVECIRMLGSDESVELTAVARDGLIHSARGFLSHEAYRLDRYGVAAPSRAEKNLHLPATSPHGGAATILSN